MSAAYHASGPYQYITVRVPLGNPADVEAVISRELQEALAAPELVEALREIVGQKEPNRYGYDAAQMALDDAWRARARAALAKAGAL